MTNRHNYGRVGQITARMPRSAGVTAKRGPAPGDPQPPSPGSPVRLASGPPPKTDRRRAPIPPCARSRLGRRAGGRYTGAMTVLDRTAFIRRHTRLQRPPHAPELELYLADEITPIWK